MPCAGEGLIERDYADVRTRLFGDVTMWIQRVHFCADRAPRLTRRGKHARDMTARSSIGKRQTMQESEGSEIPTGRSAAL
jgi:hypothetical protein